MATEFKDITYMGKTLSSLNLRCVDFEDDSEIPLGLKRSITKGEVNRYRVRSNHIYTTYDDPLEFNINIIKDESKVGYDQEDLKFSKSDVRQITKWLTSTTIPQLLIATDDNDEIINYCGIFTNIETFVVGGNVYGFILTFTNDSPFAYSEMITKTYSINGSASEIITNNSDLLDDYLYPVIEITPTSNTDFYICNLSDCCVLDSGSIAVVENDENITLQNFINKIESFATTNGYTLEYYYDGAYVKTLANSTAMRIKLIERDGTEHFCFTYYLNDGTYKIIEGGFLTLKLYSNLSVKINCELATIQDSTGRMVHFKNIGLEDEDYIYWIRLISDNNTLLLYGENCTVKFEYREMLKVGAI